MSYSSITRVLILMCLLALAGMWTWDAYDTYFLAKWRTPEGCQDIPIKVLEPGMWACLATEGNEAFTFDNTTGRDAYVCRDGSFGLTVVDTDGKRRRLQSNDLQFTCIPAGK